MTRSTRARTYRSIKTKRVKIFKDVEHHLRHQNWNKNKLCSLAKRLRTNIRRYERFSRKYYGELDKTHKLNLVRLERGAWELAVGQPQSMIFSIINDPYTYELDPRNQKYRTRQRNKSQRRRRSRRKTPPKKVLSIIEDLSVKK